MAGIQITGKDMLKKYENFLNDKSNIELAEKTITLIPRPEILIEVFVADFHDKSSLILPAQTDVYRRYTSIAKILKVSEACEEPYSNLKPGMLIAVADNITGQVLNPRWEQWSKHANSPQLTTSEPMRIIRGIDAWVDKYFYALDKGEHALDMTRMHNLNKKVDEFQGPYTFLVPPSKFGPVLQADIIKEQFLAFEGESKAVEDEKKAKKKSLITPKQPSIIV